MPDRVYLFVKHDPKSLASYIANQFKGYTSRVLRTEFPHLKSRLSMLWSSSYFAAMVGALGAEAVQWYIDTQAPPGAGSGENGQRQTRGAPLVRGAGLRGGANGAVAGDR